MARKPVVFITGASKGLGLAVAKLLLTEFGANVVALSRTESPELAKLRESCGGSLMVLRGDVSDAHIVEEAVASALKEYGHLDSLILNAAIVAPLGKIASEDVSLDAWKAHFDVNFFSLISALRAALPALRKSELGGRVVFVSSGSAVKGTASMAPYNASKAAMNSLCRTLAEDEQGITCVAVRPGTVDTPMQTQLREEGSATLDIKVYEMFLNLQTDKKLIKPEESGYVVASLALKVPNFLSGKFVSWDSDECKEFRRE
ncbi:uncharacterized protein FIBRA_05301 [Fibroporia radiculosa]|uniref:Ketoreductase domain-containing protein n=1 Tax=Fibroporia radiculosa TaxID=599839 RepID=J4H3F4_9APHY|nr:uncharacterized protein FIBRA_05301 [Fibroporia radiculosa]CCM03179.1 predicted protein [Fibroporia radiculosa]